MSESSRTLLHHRMATFSHASKMSSDEAIPPPCQRDKNCWFHLRRRAIFEAALPHVRNGRFEMGSLNHIATAYDITERTVQRTYQMGQASKAAGSPCVTFKSKRNKCVVVSVCLCQQL